MKISAPFGSGCVGDPLCVKVTDCEDFDSIAWTFLYKPVGAADPQVVHLGGGTFEIVAEVKGAYVLSGECCG